MSVFVVSSYQGCYYYHKSVFSDFKFMLNESKDTAGCHGICHLTLWLLMVQKHNLQRNTVYQKSCGLSHGVKSLDSNTFSLPCFSAVCLQAAYQGWPSSAWAVLSSWEPTRRSVALCYSRKSSLTVLSSDLVEEPQGKRLFK